MKQTSLPKQAPCEHCGASGKAALSTSCDTGAPSGDQTVAQTISFRIRRPLSASHAHRLSHLVGDLGKKVRYAESALALYRLTRIEYGTQFDDVDDLPHLAKAAKDLAAFIESMAAEDRSAEDLLNYLKEVSNLAFLYGYSELLLRRRDPETQEWRYSYRVSDVIPGAEIGIKSVRFQMADEGVLLCRILTDKGMEHIGGIRADKLTHLDALRAFRVTIQILGQHYSEYDY